MQQILGSNIGRSEKCQTDRYYVNDHVILHVKQMSKKCFKEIKKKTYSCFKISYKISVTGSDRNNYQLCMRQTNTHTTDRR